jgi:glycosyltransferase involved in cell wall biosynthesis
MNLNFQMVFFGREPLGGAPGCKAAMEDEMRKLNVRDVVQLAGHRTDIEAVIASLDVLLMPSPAETFGRVLIEAMASGVPVVASSGGGVSSIIRHHVDGLLVKPLDIEEMADGVRFFCDYPDKRKKIVENGLDAAHGVYESKVVDQKLFELLGIS